MFTVHIDLGHHEFRDFTIHDAAGRTRQERAESLCRMIGGLHWEVEPVTDVRAEVR